MKKTFLQTILATILCISLTLSIPLPAAGQSFKEAMASTSIRLLQETMAVSKPGENLLLSPDSILTALSLLENGASGQTLVQMENALGGLPVAAFTKGLTSLHKKLTCSTSFQYEMANSIWYKEGAVTLKKAFVKKAKKAYQAQLFPAAFDGGTVKKINAWVSEKTHEKIPYIVEQLNPGICAAVLNAVYFKGDWNLEYDTTTKRNFTLEDGTKKKVDMLEGTESVYVKCKGGKGFVKNYKGGQVAFLGLLPPSGMTVKDYVNSLSGGDLIRAYNNRLTYGVTVKTRLPEFEYSYSLTMENILQRMGMTNAFSPMADFSKMAKTDLPFYIDQVIHKTYIKVDKEGSEAAAATGIFMILGTSTNEYTEVVKKVYLNRPFVYAILDTASGIPLFLGVVYNP